MITMTFNYKLIVESTIATAIGLARLGVSQFGVAGRVLEYVSTMFAAAPITDVVSSS